MAEGKHTEEIQQSHSRYDEKIDLQLKSALSCFAKFDDWISMTAAMVSTSVFCKYTVPTCPSQGGLLLLHRAYLSQAP